MTHSIEMDPSVLAAAEVAADLRRKGMTNALIHALSQICGRNPVDWVDALQGVTGLLFAGKLTGSHKGFNLEIYVEELRQKVGRFRGEDHRAIVVTSQMPSEPSNLKG